MRIPHYLQLAPSGVWHYRQRIPARLIPLIGRSITKKSLLTRELGLARDLALRWWRAYDELHINVRRLGMAGKTKDVQLLIEQLKRAGQHYRLIKKPDGTIEVEVLGPEDHALAMDAVARIGDLTREPYIQQAAAESRTAKRVASTPSSPPSAAPPPAPVARSVVPAMSHLPNKAIGKAIDEWEAEIKSGTRPKTLVIKRLAVADFVKVFGSKRPIFEVTRVEIGAWVSELRARNLATPTIVNRLSYFKGFLEWCKGKGFIEFPRNDSPATGHVTYKTREKRMRKKHGYRAFNDSQLKLLFAPVPMGKLHKDAQLGTWMGLYLGARVSEIGQLALEDFFDVEGIPCVRITDEGEGQSTKNHSSNRIIPVHPELIKMGLLKKVARMRSMGETRLFSKVGKGAMNGAGDWLSKAFGRYVKLVLPAPDVGKLGFHSFRKTVIQTLQAASVQAELRAAYVGHELDDEHHASYSMDAPKQQILDAIGKLDYPVSPAADAFK
jgi:integrase